MREAYTRREAIAAGLLGVTLAALVWGPVVLRLLGPSRTVDLGTLRLAEDLSGAQPRRLSAPRVKTAKATPGSRIDINHADAAALQTLPGIGPTLAQRIITHREANGSFADTHGLLEVKGIGVKRFEKVEPWVEAR